MAPITTKRLRVAMQIVEQQMRQRFADKDFAHDEPVFAAAALLLPDVQVRRIMARGRATGGVLGSDGAAQAWRECSRFALVMQGEQFNLEGNAPDSHLLALARERIRAIVLEKDPAAQCQFVEPHAASWLNAEHLVGSPRLSLHIGFARVLLRTQLHAYQLENETPETSRHRAPARL